MEGIGFMNLIQALFTGRIDTVGYGATSTSIPTTNMRLVPSAWKGGYIYFVNGLNQGQYAQITDNTDTTLTVTGLPIAPSQGDVFLLFLGPQVNVNVAAPENVAQWGGVAVTGRDISLDLADLSSSIGIPGAAVPSKSIQIAGSDGTNLRQLLTDTGGRAITFNEQVNGPFTTSALVANGTYTSSTVTTNGFSRITGSVFADQPGTLNVQQSPNGTNWDVVSSFSVSANTGLGFSVELVCPYVRINYVNGATAQTVFRLYSFLRRFS